MTFWTDVCFVTSHTVISPHPLAMLACLHSTRPADAQDIKSSFLLPISHCSQVKSKEAVINTALKASDSITVIDRVLQNIEHISEATVLRGKLGTEPQLGGHQFNFLFKGVHLFYKIKL